MWLMYRATSLRKMMINNIDSDPLFIVIAVAMLLRLQTKAVPEEPMDVESSPEDEPMDIN